MEYCVNASLCHKVAPRVSLQNLYLINFVTITFYRLARWVWEGVLRYCLATCCGALI